MTTTTSPTPSSARDLLRGRVLTVAGDGDARQHASLVDAGTEGLVLTSARRFADAAGLRRAYPDVLLILEPREAMKQIATPEHPFILPASDAMITVDVDAILTGQRDAGARVAMTPTGYIRAQEPETLRAVITAGNRIQREDTLLHVFLSPLYLHPDNIRQTAAILRKSTLPVALTVASKTDPMSHRGVVDGLRRLYEQLDWAMLWRGDLAAFDGFAHGAVAASMGTLTSTRHGVPAGQSGQSSPDDTTPSVLAPGLARYIRAGKLREWFAATDAPCCSCKECNGRRLDRFEDTAADLESAMRHNAFTARMVREDLFGAPVTRTAWYEFVDRAIEAHAELRTTTSIKVKTPSVLNKWATRYSVPAIAASTVSSNNQEAGE